MPSNTTRLTHCVLGRKVRVFYDPVERTKLEGEGVIRRIEQTPERTGFKGIYRVRVTFGRERENFERYVHEDDVFGD